MDRISFADPVALLAIAIAVALGGILKGATGAGAPILAVPVIAAFHDVRVAVAVMVVPSLVTNLAQLRRYRAHDVTPGFARNMALSGAAGAGAGTVLLATLPVAVLQIAMAVLIAAYILLRVARPGLKLALPAARLLVWPAGFFGGVLQGAVGLSAPIALTFLNAMRLERPTFVFTVSTFFAAMSATQLVTQAYFGIMTTEMALLGVLALIPLLGAMPLGEWIGRRITPAAFDLAILAFLAVVAVRIVWVEIAG